MRAKLVPILCLAVSAGAHADPGAMRPGLWEITTEVDMAGMPMKMPPQTNRACITAEDLARSGRALPQGQAETCQISDHEVDGDTTRWHIACGGDVPMQGDATMTSSASRYSGSMDSVMQSPAGEMRMTTRWQGKRIGNCP